jgi:hypothetical protein
MAGRDIDRPSVRQHEVDHRMRRRDRGRANFSHRAADASAIAVGRPDGHAGPKGLHGTLAVRGGDPRSTGETDRARRLSGRVALRDGDRAAGIDRADDVPAGRAGRIRRGDVLEAECPAGTGQGDRAQHLPFAVDREDLARAR